MHHLRSWWREPAVKWAVCVLAWLLCGRYLWLRFDHARHEFDKPARVDGNDGHAQIDFGGQWVMARMFVADSRHLYHRDHLWPVVQAGFPQSAEDPTAARHDADAMMAWFVGDDPPAGDGIGGPLYPPVHGLLYAPLGRLDPQPAYRLFRWLSVGFAVFAGLAISRSTGIWVPLVILAVLLFPGGRGGIDLGQNHTLTLAILSGGWWAMSRGRWALGGAVWGLLAFKPVWAVAFLPVPLLMGHWRASAAMCGTAGALILATLPVVGVRAWLEWLAVGGQAADLYGVNENWVSFSRDLAGLPRRLLLDFDAPETSRGSRLAAVLGWTFWTAVAAATVVIYRLQPDRRPGGRAAGFLLLGAYLVCYRFMYYDVVLATLPLALLVAGSRREWVPLGVVAALIMYENWLIHHAVEVTLRVGAVGGREATAQPGRRLLTLAGSYRYAWDTALLLVVWAWMAWRLLSSKGVESGPDVGRPHQGLADQNG